MMTLCMLGNFSCFCYSLLTSLKLIFSKTKTIKVSKGFDQDRVEHSVSPDKGSNCLQRLSADDKSRR